MILTNWLGLLGDRIDCIAQTDLTKLVKYLYDLYHIFIVSTNRVKAEIAKQGGLVDLMWDGNLKRSGVKSEWKARQQEAFSKLIKVDWISIFCQKIVTKLKWNFTIVQSQTRLMIDLIFHIK